VLVARRIDAEVLIAKVARLTCERLFASLLIIESGSQASLQEGEDYYQKDHNGKVTMTWQDYPKATHAINKK
jgi:hypothetical protein